MGGKAKPKKHTAAEIAAKVKAANQSVGGGQAGLAERDAKAKLTKECMEPGCAGVKITSLTVMKTHWENKHCTCRRSPCECFPSDKYEPMFERVKEVVHTHHNQAATLSSNKNASKSVRDKLKAQQAAAAICDASKTKAKSFTAAKAGPSTI